MKAGAARPPRPAPAGGGDALFDGIPAGFAAALGLLLGFLALDLAGGRALLTPVRIGSVVLERLAADGGGPSAGRELSAGVAFILLLCMSVGALVTWLLTRARRPPSGATTLVLSFAVLQGASLALDAWSQAGLFPWARPWAALGTHALAAGAMTLVLAARWPRLLEGRRELRNDEP